MARFADNSVFDAALNLIGTATLLTLNTTQPADRAAAIADSVVPNITPSFTGPADGDVSGRKITLDATSGTVADANGTVTHAGLSDGSTLLYVLTTASTAITSGTTVGTTACDIEILDPSAPA